MRTLLLHVIFLGCHLFTVASASPDVTHIVQKVVSFKANHFTNHYKSYQDFWNETVKPLFLFNNIGKGGHGSLKEDGKKLVVR